MKRWVAHTIVMATLIFTYPQVHEYSYFHFCIRQMAMRLSVAPASTPRSPSTEATKGVKCIRQLKKVLRYFLLFSRLEVSRHFYGVLD